MPGEKTELALQDKALSGALMRVNHVGEVCAQALYAAQALGKMGASAAAALPELTAAARCGPDPLRDAARQAARLVQEA